MVRSGVFSDVISTYAFLSWQGAGKARKSGRDDEKTHWNLVVKTVTRLLKTKSAKSE
jgi:hypothetical protein